MSVISSIIFASFSQRVSIFLQGGNEEGIERINILFQIPDIFHTGLLGS
ncbi:MAG: hypothetical protein L0H53_13125 [Candidatus Nitrosocosmicus sp.]|nr:hypothetical protein [Candidatus Nitrosocosmicus sp.]